MLKTDVLDAHWRISFLDENLTGMLQPRSPLYRRQFALGLYFGGILHFQSTYIDQASAWHALVAAYFDSTGPDTAVEPRTRMLTLSRQSNAVGGR